MSTKYRIKIVMQFDLEDGFGWQDLLPHHVYACPDSPLFMPTSIRADKKRDAWAERKYAYKKTLGIKDGLEEIGNALVETLNSAYREKA